MKTAHSLVNPPRQNPNWNPKNNCQIILVNVLRAKLKIFMHILCREQPQMKGKIVM